MVSEPGHPQDAVVGVFQGGNDQGGWFSGIVQGDGDFKVCRSDGPVKARNSSVGGVGMGKQRIVFRECLVEEIVGGTRVDEKNWMGRGKWDIGNTYGQAQEQPGVMFIAMDN